MRPDQRVSQLTDPHTGHVWWSDRPIGTSDALAMLRDSELVIQGRVRDASNLVLWCELAAATDATDAAEAADASNATEVADPSAAPDVPDTDGPLHAVYKPISGERPLDDFPEGTLALREEAAWLVSEALGWAIVPPTIVRDGPAGRGMVQLYIDIDERVDVFRLVLTRDACTRRMALFDVLVENADRKGGHILVTPSGDVHGIDHGICFSTDPKLRTVLWGWRGEALTDQDRRDIEGLVDALDGDLSDQLAALLSDAEIGRLRDRAEQLLARGTLPWPDPRRHIIPWPPF